MPISANNRTGLRLCSFLILFAVCLVLMIGCGGSSPSPRPNPSPTVTPNPPTPTPTPAFTSTPPAEAAEGELYTYEIAAAYPSNVVTFSLQTAPEGAAIDGSTLSWTPTHAQSRVPNAFTIRATGSEGGTAMQSFSVSPAGSVDVTFLNHHIVSRSLVDAPAAGPLPYILTPDGEGGFTQILPTDVGKGHASFPRVPAGHYWLYAVVSDRLGLFELFDFGSPFRFVWTDDSDLDLGRTVTGRPDMAISEDMITDYFNLTFSSPLEGSFDVSLYCPNANESSYLYEESEGRWTYQFSSMLPLIDSSRGDEIFLLRTDSWLSANNTMEVAGPITMQRADGAPANVTATLQAVIPESAMHPVIKEREFEDAIASLIPGAVMQGVLKVTDVPYDGAEGPGSGITFIQATIPWAAGDDLDMGEIPLSNPFPGHSLFTRISLSGSAQGQSSTLSSLIGPTVSLDWARSSLPDVETPVAPEIGPVTSPRIDGHDLLKEGQTISLTPTLSWEPPAFGTPTHYEVTMYALELFPTGGGLIQVLPTFSTQETSFKVPVNVIIPGATHAFRIKAVYEPGKDMEHSPFQSVRETYSSLVVSPLFTAEGTPAAVIPGSPYRKMIPIPRKFGSR